MKNIDTIWRLSYEGSPRLGRRRIPVLAIPKSLPDLIPHENDLRAGTDQARAAMDDLLAWLLRNAEANSVPLSRELHKLRHAVALGRCCCFNSRGLRKKRCRRQRAERCPASCCFSERRPAVAFGYVLRSHGEPQVLHGMEIP